MDGTNNPTLHSAQGIVGARRFAYLAERVLWTNPPVTRHILCLALRAIGYADVRLRYPDFVVDKFVWNDKDDRRSAP